MRTIKLSNTHWSPFMPYDMLVSFINLFYITFRVLTAPTHNSTSLVKCDYVSRAGTVITVRH